MTLERLHDVVLDQPVAEGNRTITVRGRWRLVAPATTGDLVPEVSRAVLVKTLKPGIRLSPPILRAFAHEAELLGRVHHPALPLLLEFLVDAERAALVFPDHGGTRLEVVLAKLGRLDAVTAMAIAVELSRAVGAIHQQGEVHGRILARHVELNPQGTVRLFGLGPTALASADAGADDEADEVLPLPEDMAPEQIIGEPPDARSDVFLVGLLLYRMVAGDKPFRSGDGLGVAQRIRQGPPLRLERRVAGIPPSLQRIVTRCLSRRPRDRYPDMACVTSALTSALRAETSAPTELCVNAALVRADLAEPVAGAAEGGRPGRGRRPPGRPLRLGLALGVVGALLVLGWAIYRTASPAAPDLTAGVRGIEQQPARLRVLARPWAEVHVDDEFVDVTPMARAIHVTPGRHRVLFKHPHAPPELRNVEVIAGQTLWLDVTMAVVRPVEEADAGPDAAVDASL